MTEGKTASKSDKSLEEYLWMNIRDKNVPADLVNAMLIGYQIALSRTLGVGASAMSMLLARNAMDFLKTMKELGVLPESTGSPIEDIKIVITGLRLADKVDVEHKDNTYTVRIMNSVFAPALVYLENNGLPFTLSPEAFLIAGILLYHLSKESASKPKLRISVTSLPDNINSIIVNVKIV